MYRQLIAAINLKTTNPAPLCLFKGVDSAGIYHSEKAIAAATQDTKKNNQDFLRTSLKEPLSAKRAVRINHPDQPIKAPEAPLNLNQKISSSLGMEGLRAPTRIAIAMLQAQMAIQMDETKNTLLIGRLGFA